MANSGTSTQDYWGNGLRSVFSLWIMLISYYTAERPHAPQPEHGWTVGLEWTHPVSYGSEQDEKRLQWFFGLFFPSFGLIALGEMIKIYKLDDYSGLRSRLKLPWGHKWGP